MDLGLTGKKVLITGANGNIGRAIVTKFFQENAITLIHYRKVDDRIQKLKENFNQDWFFKADLTCEEEVKKMFSQIEEKFGAIDIVVANAGFWNPNSKMIHEMSLDDFKNTIDSNLTSTFLVAREFFKNCIKYKTVAPALVMIGSTAGYFGEAMHADYAAAKSALMFGFCKSLKNEIVKIAPLGRVNVVAPGWTATESIAKKLNQSEALENTLKTIALKKIATTDEVAAQVVSLASPVLSSHVTGQCVFVDGGMEGRILHL